MIRGIKFPWRRRGSSLPEIISESAVVSQNIREIVMSAAGEREMLPGWGRGLMPLLFEKTEVAGELARRTLMEGIANFEPRALISSIDFLAEETTITVTLAFVLRSSSEQGEVSVTLQRTT